MTDPKTPIPGRGDDLDRAEGDVAPVHAADAGAGVHHDSHDGPVGHDHGGAASEPEPTLHGSAAALAAEPTLVDDDAMLADLEEVALAARGWLLGLRFARDTYRDALVDLVRATSLLTVTDGASDALFKVLDQRTRACHLLGIDPTSPAAAVKLS